MTGVVGARAERPGRRAQTETLFGLGRRGTVLLVGMVVGLLASELAESMVTTALPTLVTDLADPRLLGLVTTAYLAAGTVVVPAYGWAADRVGRQRLLVLAATLFLVGSVIAAVAQEPASLVAARVVQGLGGGGFLVLVQIEVGARIPLRRRPVVMSWIGVVFALAVVAGPVLGGWLAAGPGWRWVFWSVVPLALVALVAVLARTPARPSDAGPTGTVSSDTAPGPTRPLRRETQVRLAAGGAMLIGVAAFGTLVYLPTYLQLVVGLSPPRAGLMMLPAFVGLGALSVGSARVVGRGGSARAVLVAGAAAVAAGLALLGLAGSDPALWAVTAGLVLLGAGTGCVWELVVVAVQAGASQARLGAATGMGNLLRELGVLVGTAAVGAWLSRSGPLGAPATQAAYAATFHQVFWALAPVALIAAGLFARLEPWTDASHREQGGRR